MQRLFVALRIPSALRRIALATMGGVPGARWQSEDQLHCTLAFAGAVDRHRVADIDAALAPIRGGSLPIALAGAGMFGKPGRATSLWLGVAPDPALMQLQRSVAHALALAGIGLERRAYMPHLTTARLPRGSGPPEPWIARHAALSTAVHRVGDFFLFESFLGTDGAHYEPLGRYDLR